MEVNNKALCRDFKHVVKISKQILVFSLALLSFYQYKQKTKIQRGVIFAGLVCADARSVTGPDGRPCITQSITQTEADPWRLYNQNLSDVSS